MAITINGTLTLDETTGLQTGGVAAGDEDNNDNDVTLATLLAESATFYNRLFTAGGFNLPTTFATDISVAKSAGDFISVDNGTVTSLGFVDGDGNPLPVYGGADPGVATNLTAVDDGDAIVLFADDTLGDRLVLGVDEDGNIVFAIFMEPSADLTTARVWMVQLEAITNGDDGDHDDPEDLFDSIGVAAGSTLEFTFDTLPSGSNLFGIVGDPDTGLVIIGKDIALKADGTYISNQTQEIKTSQAGVNATIGIESQMFDPGDAAYFTFVNEPDPNVTGLNLGSTEADDADNISYGSTLEGTGAFVRIAQLQGNTAPTMSIQCFNIEDDPQGRDFIAERGQNDPNEPVPLITAVRVYAPDGVTLLESYAAGAETGMSASITISVTNGVATIAGFSSNYLIEWDTNAEFDQVLISGVAGKFDIGGFGLTEAITTSVDIGDKLIFEDDGPDVELTLDGEAELRLDETDNDPDDNNVGGILATNSLAAAAYLTQDDAVFGSDGEAGTNPTVWSLSLTGADPAGVDSGLNDTLSGDDVLLFVVDDQTIVGKAGGAGGPVVLTITIDATTGELTATQDRAVEHDDPDDDDEDGTSSAMMDSGLIAAVRTITDGDGDSDSDSVDVSQVIKLEDDGPSVDLELNGTAEVTVDETGIDPDVPGSSVSASITFANLFSLDDEDFGSDGEGTSGSVYELVLNSAVSGLTDTATGDPVVLSILGNVITGSVNGGTDVVFTIELDPVTQDITLTQYRAMVHDDPDDPLEEGASALTLPEGTIDIQRTVTDGDGDSASDAVDISEIFKFEDDGPDLGPAAEDGIDLLTDDTDVQDTASRTTVELFPQAPDYGNDGPNALTPKVYTLELSAENALTDLVDTATGKAILLVTVGDDVVGYVDEDSSGVIELDETLEAIRYTIVAIPGEDVEKQVDFVQSRAVYHDGDPLPETVGDGLVSIKQVAYDGDGDVSGEESVDLGAVTFISDDEPEIGPIANSIVDFAAGDSSNEDLNGVVGKDPNTSPYTLTSYTTSLTVNGVDLEAVLASDAKSVSYYDDSSGNGTFGDETDVEYYRLVLGDQGGEGDYTFSVLVDPPPAFTEFTFEDLPSGSNLFGIVGEGNAGLVVFGRDISLKADNTYTPNQTQEIKTSQAGPNVTIGIESQMFDPGDAAYFTFVNNPNSDFTGLNLGSTEADDADNILYGSTLEGDSAFVRIAQLQGNTAPSMSIEVFNIEDDPQGVNMINSRGDNEAGKDPDVIAVRVYAADGVTLLESYSAGAEAGMSASITISITNGVATVAGFSDDYLIAWDADEDFDQTLITGVAGKFDIGGFGFFQGNDTPDQVLEFEATVTDGDADTDAATWKVGIDGTGVFDDGIVSLI